MPTMPPKPGLQYDNLFWEQKLGSEFKKTTDVETKLHLTFSLLIFLGLTIAQLLEFIFTSSITAVKTCAGMFLGYRSNGQTSLDRYAPGAIYQLWANNFSKNARLHLHEHIIQPCANEIAQEESKTVIGSLDLKVRLRDLTMSSVRELLSPSSIANRYKQYAPFTWNFLYAWMTTKNQYQTKAKKHHQNINGEENSDSTDREEELSDWDDDPNLDGVHLPRKPRRGYLAYSRNPVTVC